jgi:hypothetical protein
LPSLSCEMVMVRYPRRSTSSRLSISDSFTWGTKHRSYTVKKG